MIYTSHYSEWLMIKPFLLELLILMSWGQIPCLTQKSIDRRKIHLITGKNVSAVLFHFVFSSPPHFALGKKSSYRGVKLFKRPVEHGTISIVQKTFLPTGGS